MNQTRIGLSSIWNHFQSTLFSWLEEDLGELTDKQKQLVEALELIQVETHLPYVGRVPGRPLESRCAIARAFVAKAVYNRKADLPSACNVGSKRNSKGYKTSWIGYKLHIDASDGGIPISCLLTSASLHDSQVAIPLAEVTSRRFLCAEKQILSNI
ncbi:hypothetical protein [Marinobacter gelidimuriae]|uniref:hypothetical protein n=1 Tax=Marinobacter gelidimuriae TaxID=2739064 RepID=UPI0003656283|nr:hypothetical protein [Marinobacter gelidimuriae]